MFSASLRFTPAGLARKNAPGVFVVIVRERRATSDAEWRLYRRNLGGPTRRAGPFFGHAALSVAYVERLHCAPSALLGRNMASGRRMNETATDPRPADPLT